MDMKKLKYLLLAGLSALAVVACTEKQEDPMPEMTGLKLNLRSAASPLTKSVGLDAFNENTVSYVDVFLYTDAEGTTAAKCHKRITGLSGATETNSLVSSTVTLTSSDGLTAGTTYYVYVLANLPDAISLQGTETLAAIQALATTADFTATQSTFIMDNAMAALPSVTLQSKTVSSVDIDLYRLAAKVTMTINILKTYTENGITYTPTQGSVSAYMVNAVNNAVIAGTPMLSSSESTSYFTYGSSTVGNGKITAPTTVTIDNQEYWQVKVNPFYTYPQQWSSNAADGADVKQPYIKIALPWTVAGTTTTTKNYYYKILIPGTVGTNAESLDRNTNYAMTVNVGVVGSEFEEGPVVISTEYYVVPWGVPDEFEYDLGDLGHYLSVAKKEFYIYGGNTLDINVLSSHDISASVIKKEVWGYDSSEKKSDWWTNSFEPKNTYTVSDPTLTPNGAESLHFAHTLNNAVNSSMDCYVLRYTLQITNTAGDTETVTVYQYPPIYVDAKEGGNAFVNGYFGYVNINDNTTYYQRASGVTTAPQTSTGNNISVTYGKMVTAKPSDLLDMTVITISAFTDDSKSYTVGTNSFDYVLTDPRTSTIKGSALTAWYSYTVDQTNGTQAWDSGAVIKVGDVNTTAPGRNFIAPRFMISSTYGRNPGNASETYNNAKLRCATYQEAGYPAGRWRLPTEAEVMFVASLQSASLIGTLFNTSTNYWVSNGTIIKGTTVSSGTGASLRCVYDLWYWGEDPVDEAKSAAGYYNKYTIAY